MRIRFRKFSWTVHFEACLVHQHRAHCASKHSRKNHKELIKLPTVESESTLNWHILPGGVFVGWYKSGGTYEPSGSTGEAAPYDAMGTLSSRVSIRYCLHHSLIKETKIV